MATAANELLSDALELFAELPVSGTPQKREMCLIMMVEALAQAWDEGRRDGLQATNPYRNIL